MDQKRLPAGARDKLPFWFPAAWSTRAVALSMQMTMAGFMTVYFTDVLGLNPAIIGVLLMISRFSDAITDLLIGFIVDRTNTKLGKARPYEFAIVVLWATIYAMYAAPEMSKTALYVWVFVTYFIQNSICVTVLYGNEPVYLVRAVKKPENRTRMISAAGIYQMVLVTMAGMIVPQLIARAGNDRHSWATIVFFIAVPCAIIGLGRFFFVPELKDAEEPTEKAEIVSLKKAFGALKGNEYLWMLAAMYFIYHFSTGFNGGMATYYTKWNMGDIGLQTWLNAAALLAMPILIFVPKLMDKWGTAKTLRIGFIIMALGPVIRWVGGANLPALMIGSALFVVGAVPISFMMNIYLFECMDYGEWKLGTRIEGVMGSVNSFMAKMASALSGALQGFLIAAIGYVGTKEVQSASTLTGITVLFNLVPLVLVLVALYISYKYDVEKKIPQIRAELEARKAQPAAAVAEEAAEKEWETWRS